MKIVFNAPFNNLSFGNVSFNLLREMYKRGCDVSIFPISSGSNIDLGSYDKTSSDFLEWIKSGIQNSLKTVKASSRSIKLWHLMGSENRITPKQTLFTFYELDSPTQEEINLIRLQDKVAVSSLYTKQILEFSGIESDKIIHSPLGFDEDFHVTGKDYRTDGFIHFGLMGKWEKRKHTARILKNWVKKYGNNLNYRLSCCIVNPFFNPEQMNSFIGEALDGKRYFNVNFLPFLPTNSQFNDFLNSIDIDLTGLSGAEGWNLPAFNATALGKWSIVLNATAHKDWANKENSIQVEPSGKISSVDGIFFKNGLPFNQGNIFTWEDDDMFEAMEIAVKKGKGVNSEGLKLQKEFTYSKTLNKILEE